MRPISILCLLLAACSTPATRPAPEAPKAEPAFQVLPLAYSSADELASTLNGLFTRNPDVRVMVDRRTNSLLVMAGPEDMTHIEALVRRLDIEVKPTK
jgi:type II secretory pathway component GspD/PulD (secretin)